MSHSKNKRFRIIFLMIFMISVFTAEAKYFSFDVIFKEIEKRGSFFRNKKLFFPIVALVGVGLFFWFFKKGSSDNKRRPGSGARSRKKRKPKRKSYTQNTFTYRSPYPSMYETFSGNTSDFDSKRSSGNEYSGVLYDTVCYEEVVVEEKCDPESIYPNESTDINKAETLEKNILDAVSLYYSGAEEIVCSCYIKKVTNPNAQIMSLDEQRDKMYKEKYGHKSPICIDLLVGLSELSLEEIPQKISKYKEELEKIKAQMDSCLEDIRVRVSLLEEGWNFLPKQTILDIACSEIAYRDLRRQSTRH